MGKHTSFGPYELRSRPSTGGMAEVFHAIDSRTGSACAIKRLLTSVSEDEEVVQMFEDEARIASELDHPSIARVLEFGAIDGQYFIAYELVDGVDLRVVFDAASMASEPLPLPFLLYVFRSIAEALAYAHTRVDATGASRSIVHRDVSPPNIVVSFAGDAKLIDFGIAKARGKASRTGAGVLKGKLGYMSPEQVRGGLPDAVDERTDLFSLGICMWELLTLRRLFTASNEILVLDMVKHHVAAPPSAHRPLGAEGPELDRIVLKALAKRHDERYRSARELAKDLDTYATITAAEATRADVARTMRRTFGDRSTGSIMELQETRMSDDNKSGSDLDIFEGLGKKSSGRTSAAPPPPPGSASQIAAAPDRRPSADMKKTLMGIPGPAQPPSAGSLPVVPPAPPTTPTTSAASPAAASSASTMPSAPPASGGRISAPPPLPPPPSGSMRAAAPSAPPQAQPSKPPPPPGRGSLPNLSATSPTSSSPSQSGMQAVQSPSQQPPSVTQKVQSQVPAPPSTRPGPAAVSAVSSSASTPAAQLAAPAAPPTAPGSNGGKLDMDWDDEDEATHVFDKEKEGREDREDQTLQATAPTAAGPESRHPEHASMDEILSSPPRASIPAAGTPPPAMATLSGAFGSLGQPAPQSNGSSPPSAQFRSGPPPSQSLRSAPPPPPASLRPQNASTSTAPIPPPPPPGQTSTAPMHMPPHPSQPPMGAHPGMAMQGPQGQAQGPHGSVPPQHISQHPQSQGHQHVSQHPQQHSQPPMPQMPPVSRAMEATSIVPRHQPESKAGLWVALLVGVFAAVGIAVFFLMPRTGTLVVNVADAKGGAVSKLEIDVDGKKACDSAPCIVKDVQSGVHQVTITAIGFDPPAARAVTIEARKDSSIDFSLSASHTAGGTGVKVSGNPLQTGVRLLVDGKEIGPLPQELHDLTPGSHTVKVVGSERYAPLEKTVDVKQDELTDLGTVALKVLKGKATIQLGTPGAKVYLVSGTNRKEVPQFPIGIDFDPNEKWQLEAKMLGMDDYSQPISFDDGQAEKTIVVTLNPKGAASITAPPVRTAPLAAPQAPVVAAAPQAPAAPVAPKAAAADPPVAKDPPAAAKKDPPAAAAGGEAFLNINSRPASTVLLDGKPLGPTPRVKVSVSAGTHTVLFVNAEESLKKSVSVTVAAGETKAVSAKLRD